MRKQRCKKGGKHCGRDEKGARFKVPPQLRDCHCTVMYSVDELLPRLGSKVLALTVAVVYTLLPA